ncbi:NAD+ synthetase [Berryella intestinalis]|uniref:NH(3)-dependent NAD(+) synthetase n=1 Tax=Berryella intestinalis TaxID=1531429 RepID=A0A0A8B4D7_9ACTN|nr:NAD(+) synthase [Berryella intestinalis]AJC11668.1 NAD+ synthetase [Berryella intestinalis]
MDVRDKYERCVAALRDYACRAGFSEAVIGLSGGIDSSVAAAMALDAFGADNVHGVLLPGPYSSDHSVSDALELARNAGIEAQTLPITGPFEAFSDLLAGACGGSLSGLAFENTQARCRMVVLMALSNRYGWMLVNTGNRSEALMGYSTLYGDTAGAFAPLGGLYKTDVYAVGRYRNQVELDSRGCPIIPENVFSKPPSAELAEGQRDEDSLGLPYAQLDAFLERVYERGEAPRSAAEAEGVAIDQAGQLIERVERSAFKRACEPPFPADRFYD